MYSSSKALRRKDIHFATSALSLFDRPEAGGLSWESRPFCGMTKRQRQRVAFWEGYRLLFT
jgi:hypothetical protein